MLTIHLTKYVFAFFFAFLVAFVMTPWIRKWAPVWGLMDEPDKRRIHTSPTPRGGGIAIFCAFHLGFLCICFLGYEQFALRLDFEWWKGFALASSLLLFTGMVDDRYGVKALIKLLGQIAAASILIAFGGAEIGTMIGLDLPAWLNVLLTLGWFLAIINAFNLIDGLDGLASGLALISTMGLVGLSLLRGFSMDAGVMLLLAGGCLAFLRYNFNPASIFLGDSGSMFIGFTLATFALETSAKGSLAVTLVVPLLAMGVPVFDTLLAIYRRSLRKIFYRAFPERSKPSGVMDADTEHLHHRILASGFTQRHAAIILYAISAGIVAVGVASQLFKDQAVGILLIAFLAGVFVVVRHLARTELWDTGRAIVRGFHRPASRVVAFILYPVLDVLCLSVCFWVALKMSAYGEMLGGPFRQIFLAQYPFWISPVFLGLCAGQVYQRVWSRSRFGDYLYLVAGVVGGCVAGLALDTFFGLLPLSNQSLVLAVIYGCLSLIVIGGNRLFLRGVQDIMSIFKHSVRFHKNEEAEVLMLYGAGGRLGLFLHEKMLTMLRPGKLRVIVGVIDDDPNLRGRLVHGFRVLGNMSEMPRLLKAHAVDTVVVTMDMQLEKLLQLQSICKEADVSMNVWACFEQEANGYLDIRTQVEALRQSDESDDNIVYLNPGERVSRM